MSTLKRFWHAVESLPSLAAVDAEWQALLGVEYDLIKPFLRPRQDRATSFPRIDGGLPYEVIEHGNDDLVAVCPETGDTITLTKSQLVVYELDRRRLAESLARAWGIDPGSRPEDWNGTMVYLGQATSSAKICHSVFLTFPNESEDLGVLATRLVAERRAPFVLFAPSRRWLRRAAETVMRFHHCAFVALADFVTASRPGQLELVEPLDAIIGRAMEDFGIDKGRRYLGNPTDRQCLILETMLEHEITSERRRRKRRDIVRLINRQHPPDRYSRDFAALVKRGHLRSIEGPHGGLWMTTAGKDAVPCCR